MTAPLKHLNNPTALSDLTGLPASNLTGAQAYLLGRLGCAYEQFKHAQRKVRKFAPQVEEAARKPSFLNYDLGEFYDRIEERVRAEHSQLSMRQVSAEKFYRRCKHEFLEACPTDGPLWESLRKAIDLRLAPAAPTTTASAHSHAQTPVS